MAGGNVDDAEAQPMALQPVLSPIPTSTQQT
jgi:hypothetical protein